MASIFDRYYQDLNWVISSPPLFSGQDKDTYWWSTEDCEKEFQSCLPSLKQLNKNTIEINSLFNPNHPKRLGHYFESLVALWIDISPNYDMLLQNHQIIIDGQTKGEIDFIIKEKHTGKLIHLEVAVKFYLGTKQQTDPYNWFGTNTKDSLGKKLDRLKTHQTQLYEKYKSHIPYSIDEKHCLLKGRLFYPDFKSPRKHEFCPPSGINNNHLKGKWLYQKNHLGEKLIVLNKENWLSALNPEQIKKCEILDSPLPLSFAQCYIRLNDDETEKDRVFYLPNEFTFPNNG